MEPFFTMCNYGLMRPKKYFFDQAAADIIKFYFYLETCFSNFSLVPETNIETIQSFINLLALY